MFALWETLLTSEVPTAYSSVKGSLHLNLFLRSLTGP